MRLRPPTEDLRGPFNNLYSPVDIQAEGVQRIAVGIGKKINSDELETIAGSPDRVVNAESFDKLDKELDEIREVSCRKLLTCQRDGRLSPVRKGGRPAILLRIHFKNLDWFWVVIFRQLSVT